MPKVEISPGPSLPSTFEARIAQPQTPTPSVMPPVALVEILTAAELIPGPRGSLWYTGTGAPTSFPGQADGDMYIDNATDHVWQLQSGVWVDTGTDLHGSPDTPADILAKLVTVDGTGSGLDADTLDGHDTPFFATQAALDAEATARGSADSTLQGNITSEASTRAAADTTLQSNINAEVTNRTNADAALQTQINTKVDATAQDTRDDAQDAAITAKIGEAPNDGIQYVRQSLAWSPVSVPPGTAMSDTPPASPINGQMWLETDSGILFVFWVDAGGGAGQWVQIGGSAQSAPVITPWVGYTPVLTNMGTPTQVAFLSRRFGDTLEITGFFVAGTAAAAEARFGLGYNGVAGGLVIDPAKCPASPMLAGEGIRGIVAANAWYMTMQPSVGYLTWGIQSAGAHAFTKANGDAIGVGLAFGFKAAVPIQGWS